ncbi:DUF4232 domain-containing protein [Streptomyces coeruleoprunus]|uniref:DUF4232 domain-containing protein n=1 Tax=Streptomyces coeruleoprunus TaxID=285563 RepID=A0ABV9XKT8_9ACTN
MPSCITARPRVRLFAAAAAALAALSLTACGGGGTGARDEGAAPSGPAPATAAPSGPARFAASPAPAGAASPAEAAAPAGSAPAARPGGTGPRTTGPARTTPPCAGATVRLTAQPVSRPLNHMLLTVTNTGSTACALYGYPAVRFEGAQAVPPVIEDSKPQAVTLLGPGESGYAGVVLSSADGSGTGGHMVTSVSVAFFDADLSTTGRPATAALPAGGVHVDSTVRVTYWLDDPQDALS